MSSENPFLSRLQEALDPPRNEVKQALDDATAELARAHVLRYHLLNGLLAISIMTLIILVPAAAYAVWQAVL